MIIEVVKRLLYFFLATAVLGVGALLAAHTANAQTSPMTAAHIDRIRANCIEAQSVLQRVHVSDALLRVNRGQLYEQIATKLMAPLNGRIAFNRLDGSALVATTGDYERQLGQFRSSYQAYEESMSQAINMDCGATPVAFYDKVTEAQDRRKKVNEATVQLQKIINLYEKQFDAFSHNFKGETS